MADLIDRNEALSFAYWHGSISIPGNLSDVLAVDVFNLNMLPTIDAVEVVRCKDCKHRYGKACDFADFWLKDDDYCSRGERREDG